MRDPLVVAFDIETCPLPPDTLPPRAARRLALRVDAERRRTAERGLAFDPDAARRSAGALHGALGWICCASFVRLGPDAQPRTPRSFAAATPADEHALLADLWGTLAQMPRRVLWVSFYGKRFDAEFLATRSLAHGLTPSRLDLLHRHPYVHRPHLDLSALWRSAAMGLDDVCELLGTPSPKRDLCGAGVADAVASGRLDRVVAYCEADAVATLRAYRHLAPLLA